MNKFFLKFYLLIFGILFFISGALFLILNHVDTIYRFVPAEAENYLHIKPKLINELSDSQKTEIYLWLKNHSSLSETAWKNLFASKQTELGLFSLNGQIFGIARNNKLIKLALTTNNISYIENRRVLYFPEIVMENKYLNQKNWFKNVHQRICFKDFILYSHNLNALQLNMPLLKNTELPVTTFLGNFDDQTVIIETLGNVGQQKVASTHDLLKTLPESTLGYFRNLRIEEIAKFNAVSDNFELSIIQKLGGGIEYYQDNNGSQAKITKADALLEQVKKAVLSSLAQLYPSRKVRILPDGTAAINLIADEQTWEFIEFAPGNWILQEKEASEEPKIKLSLKESTTNYILTFGTPSLAGTNESKCKLPKFSKAGIIFSKTNNQNFKNILIQNKNQKKLLICID